ncbi:MAG: deoxyribodipyrimidine photo-lyase [Acidobacteriota bacterium]|nr:MAG: deoxyribodipyrimidine photo-lyase [Acidobacteriota bacterium]
MQQSQRAQFNHALEHAIREANAAERSVVVGFGLMDDYPEANERHYAFMLHGLRDVERNLSRRKIKFVIGRGSPDEVALELAKEAALVVCDRGYLRHQRKWRERVAREASCAVVQVESDVVVPVEVASDKQETAARTLRPKLGRRRDEFLSNLSPTPPAKDSRRLRISGDVDVSDLARLLSRLDLHREVRPVKRLTGGSAEARRRLSAFLRHRLESYDERRNEPSAWHSSFMSPYLHFGQISPVEIALKVRDAKVGDQRDRDSFLEELIVRRELAINFVFHNHDYDSYKSLPEWARKTLDRHRGDPREHVYTRSQLEAARTHDRYWNAAMREMVHTGFMHNYMRMYWGKKILEWCRTPEYAFQTALYLNNKYLLDGRDANSYANVAWCFGQHDRGWTERAVFGKVRYMNDRGLERKFDMDAYIEQVDKLIEEES